MLLNIEADFHSVEFSDWTGNPLFTFENVALDLIRMSRVSNNLLCQIQFSRGVLLGGNRPLVQIILFQQSNLLFRWSSITFSQSPSPSGFQEGFAIKVPVHAKLFNSLQFATLVPGTGSRTFFLIIIFPKSLGNSC